MKYLLDTNTCIRYLNGRSPQLRTKFLTVLDQDIALCSVVKAEMFAGSQKSQFPERSLATQMTFFNRSNPCHLTMTPQPNMDDCVLIWRHVARLSAQMTC